MQSGRESRTSVMVCQGRAAAHGIIRAGNFSDPTALTLLPESARARVEAFRAGSPPKGIAGRATHGYLDVLSKMMVARTVAIDEAVQEAACPQLVILGAGLDGRAWRMRALRETVVFEVDHPDTQREKRARAAGLEPAAREIRFVPVDFTRDDLDTALSAAGHDPSQPTTWVWEGVVMYLSETEIAATLSVLARRSAPGSRLIILYHSPALQLKIVGLIVRGFGEPLRSTHTESRMRALLADCGFDVVRDEDVHEIGERLSPEIARGTRSVRHLRIVTADRLSQALADR